MGECMTAEIITLRDGNDLGRQLPPPGMNGNLTLATKTPGLNAGSFLIDPKTEKQAIFTPVDEETGVCLPMVTDRKLPPLGKSLHGGRVIADWNHNYHPKETLVHGTKEQVALRNSRVQWVHRDDHDSYHDEFYGPDIPSLGDMLRPIIFASAGFIPPHGMQYDGRPKAKIIALSEQTRINLWKSGMIKVANNVTVRDALIERALKKDFCGVRESTIDEFLTTANMTRRFELGNLLLAMAVHDMSSPLNPLYRSVRERHLLPPGASKSVGRCAMRIINQYSRTRAIKALAAHLAVA